MSDATDWIAANLDRIEGGQMTLSDLCAARFMLRSAIRELLSVDERIAAAHEGMRDRFAMAALTGICARDNYTSQASAREAYEAADAMMQARDAS